MTVIMLVSAAMPNGLATLAAEDEARMAHEKSHSQGLREQLDRYPQLRTCTFKIVGSAHGHTAKGWVIHDNERRRFSRLSRYPIRPAGILDSAGAVTNHWRYL
jgi:hypothetical protein